MKFTHYKGFYEIKDGFYDTYTSRFEDFLDENEIEYETETDWQWVEGYGKNHYNIVRFNMSDIDELEESERDYFISMLENN